MVVASCQCGAAISYVTHIRGMQHANACDLGKLNAHDSKCCPERKCPYQQLYQHLDPLRYFGNAKQHELQYNVPYAMCFQDASHDCSLP